MASVSRSRRALEAGSGGKIVRTRRPARTRTPYERPTFTVNPPPENPNWLARFIYSPTRSIVSGAGKVLSSVFRSDSSSSSSSELGSDDEEGDDDYVSSQEDDALNKRNGTSETVFRQGETKHAIEQLLRQETFSRDECDKLIKIIKSRVVGCTTTEDAENTRPNIDTTDLSATAVSEAKKWVMEKRLGSASKSKLDHGTSLFPQGAEDDGGSPVDVAKLYMRALPPWASPSNQHGELRSTSPLGLQLFNEETPYSIGGTSVKSKLKRDSPATGSWNIQEEIRRVRTKATEEMLRSLPSSTIDWSAYSLENRSTLKSLPDGKQEADLGDKLKNPRTAAGLTMDPSLGITTTHSSDVTEKTQDVLQKGALTSGTEQPSAIVGETIQYSKVHDQTFSTTAKEVTVHTTNGFPSSAPSLSTQLGREETTLLNGEINQVSSSDEKIVPNLLVEETFELEKETTIDLSKNNENDIDGTNGPDSMPLNEASVKVPDVNENDNDGTKENDSAPSGSQNSSSMPDELSQELTQPQSKLNDTAVAKEDSVVEKPKKATRLTRYNRRGRPRGK
ncbi:protein KAKU4 [Rosa rugosa]|uniref:protein KAKU4 n=1 Tax=Rosa rugosa TaxID=74645 RepID=UPI002B400B98|nr:protein KAKU4 [Rosa rugosa]